MFVSKLQHLMQDKCLFLCLTWKLIVDKNAQDAESSQKFYTNVQMQDLRQPSHIGCTGKLRVTLPPESINGLLQYSILENLPAKIFTWDLTKPTELHI